MDRPHRGRTTLTNGIQNDPTSSRSQNLNQRIHKMDRPHRGRTTLTDGNTKYESTSSR